MGNFGDQTVYQTAGFFEQPKGDERTKEVRSEEEEITFMMGAQHEHARRKRQHRSTVFRHNKQDTATLVLLWNGCFTSRV